MCGDLTNKDQQEGLTRRKFGKLGAGLALGTCSLGLSSGIAAGSNRLKLDASNPEHLHLMHRKLAYTLDERPVYWNIDAVRLGFRDGILTPFWNMHVGMIFKIESLADFRYRVKHVIKIFYSDLKTGELLESFNNPYTNEMREVAQPKLVKGERIFGLNGVERAESSAPDSESKGATMRSDELGPAKIIGDDVWLNADSIFRAETPNRLGRLIQVNDWSTYHGSLSELADPSVTSAAATHTFNDLNTFNHNWIGMQGIDDAWSISRGFGRKNHSVEGMPDQWKDFVADTHPELLSDVLNFTD